MTAIWLLDVDGVLNAVQVEPGPGFRRIRTPHTFTYRPAVAQRIGQLHRAKLVDVRWLSSWMERALWLPRAVPDFPAYRPVLGQREFRNTPAGMWWKAVTARAVSDADPGRPIIWTDDDLNHSYGLGELDWVIGRPMLRISPDPHYGLTDDHLAAITDYCERAAA